MLDRHMSRLIDQLIDDWRTWMDAHINQWMVGTRVGGEIGRQVGRVGGLMSEGRWVGMDGSEQMGRWVNGRKKTQSYRKLQIV